MRILAACLGLLTLSCLSHAQRLDTTQFIVIGEGLAAGQSGFGLMERTQRFSFPAQMAKQMGTIFPQPLVQGPGLGDVLGFPALPTRAPTYPQGSVRVFEVTGPKKGDEGPSLFVFNVSVPNHTLADALTRRPAHPVIHENNNQQTLINMLIGFPQLLFEDNVPLWTQLEYAEAMNPSLALVELGYYDALQAAVRGDANLMPDAAGFRTNYSTVVRRLRANFSEVVVTTIPDPIDTAFFTPALAAANFLRTPAFVVLLGYNITEADYVTRIGLEAMATQLYRRKIEALPPGSILRGAAAAAIRARVRALNTEVTNVARENSAQLYDLNALFARVRSAGIAAGSTRLTGEFLGGFYSLDGFYPGPTGHGVIANEILGLLNRTYNRSFPLVNLTTLAASDAVVQARPAPALLFDARELGFPDVKEEQQ